MSHTLCDHFALPATQLSWSCTPSPPLRHIYRGVKVTHLLSHWSVSGRWLQATNIWLLLADDAWFASMMIIHLSSASKIVCLLGRPSVFHWYVCQVCWSVGRLIYGIIVRRLVGYILHFYCGLITRFIYLRQSVPLFVCFLSVSFRFPLFIYYRIHPLMNCELNVFSVFQYPSSG